MNKQRVDDLYLKLEETRILDEKGLPADFQTERSNHIIYICHGTCVVRHGGQNKRIGPRGVLYIATGTAYTILPDENKQCVVYLLVLFGSGNSNGLNLGHLCNISPLVMEFFVKKPFICQLIIRDNIHLTIEELMYEHSKKLIESALSCRYLLSILMIKMARSFSSSGRPSGIEYVSRAKMYIAEHFDQPFSVQILAEHLGISRSYLEAIFHKYGKRSIITHVNGVRTDRAAYMLTNTRIPITDIAFATGFNSRQHFTRIFKERMGCSPIEYRKKFLISNSRPYPI